jgi:DNA-binding transcriptional regulator YiaG
MAYLQNKWRDYTRQPNPPRHYTNQREFEADWIYSLRRRYALSQEALAARANVSVTTVQNWENPRSVKAIADHNQNLLKDIERDRDQRWSAPGWADVRPRGQQPGPQRHAERGAGR